MGWNPLQGPGLRVGWPTLLRRAAEGSSTAASRLGGWLVSKTPRPADWQAGEIESRLVLGGWSRVEGAEAEVLVAQAQPKQKTPQGQRDLAHLLEGPTQPVVLRAPNGRVVLCEPEGPWPASVVPPNHEAALPILRGLNDPRSPLPEEVLSILAHTVPFDTVRLLQRVDARFSEETALDIAPGDLSVLGPFASRLEKKIRGLPGVSAEASSCGYRMRVSPGFLPGLAAAYSRHEIAHTIVAIARAADLYEASAWRVVAQVTPLPSPRARASVDDATAELVAGFMAGHPVNEDMGDTRLFGRPRIQGHVASREVTALLGEGVRTLLAHPAARPRREVGDWVEDGYKRAMNHLRTSEPEPTPEESVLVAEAEGFLACLRRSPELLAQAKARCATAYAATELALAGKDWSYATPETIEPVRRHIEALVSLQADLEAAKAWVE